MTIRTDQGDFDSDELVFIDRHGFDRVVVQLDSRTITFTGIAAQQAWAQVTEHAEYLDEGDDADADADPFEEA